MFPVLFEIPEWFPLLGGRALHTYGLLVALGFLAGMTWVRRESDRLQLPTQKILDLFFYIVLSSIIGSRILYVFASVPDWWEDPLVFFRFWEGGLVFYGGLIAAVLTSVWFCRKNGLDFFTVADVYSPGIALGHIFGRLGCTAAGCCFGSPALANSLFSITYPLTKYSIAPVNVPLYPIQLFEAVGELIIFLILFLFRKHKKFEGEVFLLYIILYPILRSILELYRGDTIRGFVIENLLSTSQFISILWVVVAVVLWAGVLRKRNI